MENTVISFLWDNCIHERRETSMIYQLQLWDWISITFFFKTNTTMSNEQDIVYLHSQPFASSSHYATLFTCSSCNRTFSCYNQPFLSGESSSTLQAWTRKYILSTIPVPSTGVTVSFPPKPFPNSRMNLPWYPCFYLNLFSPYQS